METKVAEQWLEDLRVYVPGIQEPNAKYIVSTPTGGHTNKAKFFVRLDQST